jgi:hypothetical protein
MLKNRLERLSQNAQACPQPSFNDAICVRKYFNVLNDVRTKMPKVISVVYIYVENRLERLLQNAEAHSQPTLNDTFCVRKCF